MSPTELKAKIFTIAFESRFSLVDDPNCSVKFTDILKYLRSLSVYHTEKRLKVFIEKSLNNHMKNLGLNVSPGHYKTDDGYRYIHDIFTSKVKDELDIDLSEDNQESYVIIKEFLEKRYKFTQDKSYKVQYTEINDYFRKLDKNFTPRRIIKFMEKYAEENGMKSIRTSCKDSSGEIRGYYQCLSANYI